MSFVRGSTREVRLEEVEEGVYRVTHDMTETGLTVTIALALSEVADIEPEWLISRWTEYVDPDALDRLFRGKPSRDYSHEQEAVYLEIQGIDVTIYADGVIEIDV